MTQTHNHHTGTILLVLAGLVIMTQAGHAEEKQGMKQRYAPPEIEGMRHIRIGEDDKHHNKNKTDKSGTREKSKAQQSPAPQADSAGTGNKEDKPDRERESRNKGKEKDGNKPSKAKPGSHFRSKENWQRLDVIPRLASGNTDKVNRALADVAATPHKVTPYGLLLAARGHMKHGQMRQATLYYYAARLRTRFDSLRFPANNPSALKHDRMFSQLAGQLSKAIYDWAFAGEVRFDNLLKRLRKWEHETAYAYKPLYPTPKMQKHAQWKDLHKQALETALTGFRKRAKAYRQHKQ